MPFMKLELPSFDKEKASFHVAYEDLKAFTDYLFDKYKITVHSPRKGPEHPTEKPYMLLDVQTGIPPADGEKAAKSFRKTSAE